MPYKMDWLIKDEIILIVFWGNMTVDEFRSSLVELGDAIRSSNDNIHTISDIQNVRRSVSIQDSMKSIREQGDNTKSNGWSITVGKLDFIAKMGVGISRSLLKHKTTSFDTIDAAFDHLKKEDKTLNWDKLNNQFLEFSSEKNKKIS